MGTIIRSSLRLVAAAIVLAVCARAKAFEVSYWAWQRGEPPSEIERTALAAQGARTVYWQVGELQNVGQEWRWKARFPLPEKLGGTIRFVPVIRLESREKEPFGAPSLESLLGALAGVARGADELQLDYDAPDRLVSDYASALRKIHTLVPKLSITALPHWSRASIRRELEQSVDELLPMLYDFEPDPVVPGASPLPVLDPAKLDLALGAWSDCAKPWRAGLPEFARVTVFDSNGKSRGHIREWNWDDLCFNSALTGSRESKLGVTIFSLTTATRIANTPIKRDQFLAVRWPDRAALAHSVAVVKKTTAAGVVFFRLPDSSAPSGWSLTQLGDLDAAPHLKLKRSKTDQGLELRNDSAADLEPRLSGEGSRGYALELDAPAPLFRDAHEGDFWRVIGHVDVESQQRAVAIPLATRVTFWFSHLRSGESLRTGLFQLAPGADFSQTRFRILNAPGNLEWKSIDD